MGGNKVDIWKKNLCSFPEVLVLLSVIQPKNSCYTLFFFLKKTKSVFK